MEFRFCPSCGTPLNSKPSNDNNTRSCPNCNFTHYDHPKPCAGAVIDRNGDILLIRRANEPYKDHWDFPGGFLEPDEHPRDGVKREVFEELNVKVEVRQLIGVYMDHYGNQHDSTLNMYYTCNIIEGSVSPNFEIKEAKWFSLKSIPRKLAFNHAEAVLKDWKKRVHKVDRQF
ncbi:MAG: NUDIX hydrolase [Candidatus Korarchaeota archaeon]|nr:NUDIX hydrolase [Candidatus Korarchaeota archaeon]